jgi:capsule polysaccharide export protein KpsE/RkpR
MVNIEQITSTLAKLPDQALQRYAVMHKDDPYIMSLAVSESKRRKEMRSAAQSQGFQEQPKVVDQAVAEMAQPAQQMAPMPEEQGIGALPAAAQMEFADGGITGYAGGGDIFSQFDQQKADRIAQLNGQLATIEPQLRAAASSGDPVAIQTYAQQAQEIRNQINAVREATGNRVGAIDKMTAPAVPAALSSATRRPGSPRSCPLPAHLSRPGHARRRGRGTARA